MQQSIENKGQLPEELIDDGLGVLIRHKILYHGSATKGIGDFEAAEDTTVGEGVYLTSEPIKAAGYGRVRAEGLKNAALTHSLREKAGESAKRLFSSDMVGDADAKPILYEVGVENVRLLDLRNDENLNRIMEGWRLILLEIIKDSANYIRQSHAIDALEKMSAKLVRSGSLRNITYGLGSRFNKYVESLGYEGLITLEGGEGVDIGDHDTYVIFDPSKVKVMNEQEVQ